MKNVCEVTKTNRTVCGYPLKHHVRCPYCTRLLHDEEARLGYCCDINEIKDNVKDECDMCGRGIKGNVANFVERGNFCSECNTRCANVKYYIDPNTYERLKKNYRDRKINYEQTLF